MKANLQSISSLALLGLAGLLMGANGQTPPQPAQPNPLMQLMLTQPPIDVTSPVVAEVSFDPPTVRPGQKAIYRISLNAIASNVRIPGAIPAPPPLEFRAGVQGQILRSVGNTLVPLTSINYDVRASKPGMFVVPSYYIEVYGRRVAVPAVGLEVATDVDASEVPRQLEVKPARTNLYVGETIAVQVMLPASPSNTVEAVREVQINGDGLFVEKNSIRQTVGMIERHGRPVATFVYETSVTAIEPGALRLSAQGFTSGREFGGPIVISGQTVIAGGPPQYVLLDSEPVTLNVRMLPPDELPGFKGAIGQLTAEGPMLATNTFVVGEPMEMFVTVRGNVNPTRLVPPDPPRTRGWQIFPPVNQGYVVSRLGTNAGAVFAYTLIPLSDEVRETPRIPFSAFDPQRGEYVDLTIPSTAILVLPDASYTNATSWTGPADEPAAKKPALSGLVTTPGTTVATLKPLQSRGWFVGVQIAPAFVFCGLWFWERRRRYLEQHPEIVRRRLARRELRRAKRRLHQAASAGGVADFTRWGVKALQVACAPHYPAEPRALVCADVLEVMPDEERRGPGGEVVRRLFAAADAVHFSGAKETPGELLGLMPGLDSILLKLEARL